MAFAAGSDTLAPGRRRRFTRRWLVAALGLAWVAFAVPATARTVDQLIVAGDSLSDPGNVYRLTSAVADAFPFFFDPIPESPPYFAGRFSNGPIWAEHLAARLGLPGERIDNLALGGANTAGSTALDAAPAFLRPTLEAAGLGGIQQQVDTYLASGNTVSPNGLAVVWGGANDYLFGAPTITAEGMPSPVANLRSTVLDLADAGARQFLVPNLPNLGRVPSVTGDPVRAGALANSTYWFNVYLSLVLPASAAERGLDLQIFDVASLFDAAFAGNLGFANVTTPCIDAQEACPSSLFFDGLHPTATAHALLGNFAYDVVIPPTTSVAAATDVVTTPLPGAAMLLLPAVAGLAWMRRRAART